MDGDEGADGVLPVDLGEEPWWAEEGVHGVDHVEPQEHVPSENDRQRTYPGWPSMGERAAGGWWSGMDRSTQLTLFAIVGITVLVAIVALAYVYALSGTGVPQAEPPQAGFEQQYDPAAGEVTITHAAGETVAVDRLTVTVAGEPHEAWTAEGERLRTGDAVTVRDVAPGAAGALVWHGPDGDVQVELVTFEAAGSG